ncbi:hypothetical protein [Candidatus Phytoplasma solani]|uniref:hypothetical protein n=1 Tax=Candidatus Phytoplasma solani TaxID=69896 RepID=UPI00358F03E9
MNNKKSSAPIIIILLILIISSGVGFYFWMNQTPKPETPQTTQQPRPNPNTPHTHPTHGTSAHKPEKGEEELDETKKEETQDQSTQPKFTITQANFDKVKEYIFSETDDKSLLPNDLSEQEKNKIEEIKNSWKSSLKEEQNPIDEENNKCDDYNRQIQEIKSQYPSLKSQKEQLEQQEKTKTAELNKLKYQRGEISPIYAKTIKKLSNIEIINPKTPNPELETKLKAEIKILQDERLEVVGEIDDIKVKIGKLESKQEMYEDMLSSAKSYKKILEDRFKNTKKDFQNQIITSLNALYQITSTEG